MKIRLLVGFMMMLGAFGGINGSMAEDVARYNLASEQMVKDLNDAPANIKNALGVWFKSFGLGSKIDVILKQNDAATRVAAITGLKAILSLDENAKAVYYLEKKFLENDKELTEKVKKISKEQWEALYLHKKEEYDRILQLINILKKPQE